MRRVALISLVALTAACAPSRKEPAPVVYQGTAPSGAASAAQTPAANPAQANGVEDARGIVRYDGYETIRARRGDTVASMAARAGMGAAELAAYNGLSTQYQPEAGDELVLPARADRYTGATQVAAAPQPAPQQPSGGAIPPTYQPSVAAPDEEAQAAPAPAAQPALEPARTNDGGWSAELARAAIEASPQEEAQPAPAAEPAPQPAPVEASPVPVEPTPAPAQPAPIEATPVEAAPPAEPEEPARIVAFNTGGGQPGFFQRPTAAPIARQFSRAPGPDRNDGVDFATNAGDPVVAADDGTVALVSKSLGGLGTILLVRHENQFLTVYGRLGSVNVRKGDPVQRGQVIATVANLESPRNPHLHFEVRKGAESVDPMQYF